MHSTMKERTTSARNARKSSSPCPLLQAQKRGVQPMESGMFTADRPPLPPLPASSMKRLSMSSAPAPAREQWLVGTQAAAASTRRATEETPLAQCAGAIPACTGKLPTLPCPSPHPRQSAAACSRARPVRPRGTRWPAALRRRRGGLRRAAPPAPPARTRWARGAAATSALRPTLFWGRRSGQERASVTTGRAGMQQLDMCTGHQGPRWPSV